MVSATFSHLGSFLSSRLRRVLYFSARVSTRRFYGRGDTVFLVVPRRSPGGFFVVSLVVRRLCERVLSITSRRNNGLGGHYMFLYSRCKALPGVRSTRVVFSTSHSQELRVITVVRSLRRLRGGCNGRNTTVVISGARLAVFNNFTPGSIATRSVSGTLNDEAIVDNSIDHDIGSPSRSLRVVRQPLVATSRLGSVPGKRFVIVGANICPVGIGLRLFLG